jgi:Zn-dependent protease with chaperone function
MMIATRRIPSQLAIILAIISLGRPGPLDAAESTRRTAPITRYDLSTQAELLLGHLVTPTLKGDVKDWSKSLLPGLAGQVGDWINQYFNVNALAAVITEAFPVEGQSALKPVDQLVADCARTLGVEKPAIYVRNSSVTRIYSVQSGGRYHLVLTSALLNVFEERPGELRFVVGRELGHIKCGHIELERKAYAILSAIQAINAAVVPDRYQNVLPLLPLGRLFTWCREAEFSADRAGLLCCGEPKVAYEAIMRLQHGLRADSPWIDPDVKDFDPQAVIRSFQEWQYQPFVKFILYLKTQPLEHPYYQERLAMLKVWADSGAHRALLERRVDRSAGQLIEVVKIRAYELAPEGQTVDPYAIVSDGDEQFLRTQYATAVKDAEWKAFRSTDSGVHQPRAFSDGQALFVEIWDSDYGTDTLIGGFVIYPHGRDAHPGPDGVPLAEYAASIRWDWKDPKPVSRSGSARVWVRFTQRIAAGDDAK